MKKSGINKSQAIREYLAQNPDAKPTAIQKALAARKIHVGHSLISQVKYGTGSKPVRRDKSSRRAESLTTDDLLFAHEAASKMGGIAVAKGALDLLARLVA